MCIGVSALESTELYPENAVFWDVTPCRSCELNRSSSETSIQFTRSTRHHIPEDFTPHSHRRENLNSYRILSFEPGHRTWTFFFISDTSETITCMEQPHRRRAPIHAPSTSETTFQNDLRLQDHQQVRWMLHGFLMICLTKLLPPNF
jgi:hypothetical protein